MDTAKVLIDAIKPKNFLAKAKLFGVASVAGYLALIFGTDWITGKLEEEHRLTVCWEHYRLSERAITLTQAYTTREARKYFISYKDCISAARKKAPIPPLAS
jgi:hypothetical protein